MKKRVTIYCDGSGTRNAPGGFAAVLIFGDHRKEVSGAWRVATNNQMELAAALAGLELLKTACAVDLWSDSEYVVKNIKDGNVRKWRGNRWMRKGLLMPNADLWERVSYALDRHHVTAHWLPGHSGHPENERCDKLANEARLAMIDQLKVSSTDPDLL